MEKKYIDVPKLRIYYLVFPIFYGTDTHTHTKVKGENCRNEASVREKGYTKHGFY